MPKNKLAKPPIDDLIVSDVSRSFNFIPHDHSKKSWIYTSPIPENVSKSDFVVVGIDEAGRGPVLGPMVYCALYIPESFKSFDTLAVKDSKQLTPRRRFEIFEKIRQNPNIGFLVSAIHPADMSNKMLSLKNKRNLNQIAHDMTISLVKSQIDLGFNLREVFVDALGPQKRYEDYLSSVFPGIKFTVREKADSLFPCVSAASICAKVIRDASLVLWRIQSESSGINIKITWGSGYTSDPTTINYLKKNFDYVFGYLNVVRFSWSTTLNKLKELCAPVVYADMSIRKTRGNFFYVTHVAPIHLF